MYDSAGNDTFTATPTYATLVGTGFYNYAGSFDKVYGYATAGGIDTAKLYDSAGNDTFTGYSTYATLVGTGFYNYAGSFDKVYAYATAGGTADKAILNEVHAANAVRAADCVECLNDFCRWKFLPVHCDGIAAFEFDFYIFALFGRVFGRSGNLIHHFFWLVPRVFEQTAFM